MNSCLDKQLSVKFSVSGIDTHEYEAYRTKMVITPRLIKCEQYKDALVC